MNLAVGLLLALAAPQNAKQVALEQLRAQDETVATVAYNLAVRGTALCPQSLSWKTGVKLHNKGQYGAVDRRDAATLFGLGDYPVVLATAPGGAAARAGLMPGDAIVQIGNIKTGPLPDSASYADVQRAEAVLAAERVSIVIERGGTRKPLTLWGERGCVSDVELLPSRKLNAKADGRIVQITTNVLAETQSDDELAFIVAHEMAHNILRHRERLDRIGRRTAYIRETEIEADRMGVRLMHAAGYDATAAARFWERFGKKTGAGIFSDGRHLRTKARVQLLRDEANSLTQ